MDNQHKQISGYRDLSQEEIDAINIIKDQEAQLGEVWREIANGDLNTDPRWLSIARTHFEEGFSALVRSIAKPEPRF